MKKAAILVFMCTAALSTALTDCDDGVSSAKKTADKKLINLAGFIPGDIKEKVFSAFPKREQDEITALHGHYRGPEKNHCVTIDNTGLASYSIVMNFSYTNIHRVKLSSSQRVCCSYYKNEEDYSEDDRKIILKFTKNNDGTVSLSQGIVPMDMKAGSLTKEESAPIKVKKTVPDGNGGTVEADRFVHAGIPGAARMPAVRVK